MLSWKMMGTWEWMMIQNPAQWNVPRRRIDKLRGGSGKGRKDSSQTWKREQIHFKRRWEHPFACTDSRKEKSTVELLQLISLILMVSCWCVLQYHYDPPDKVMLKYSIVANNNWTLCQVMKWISQCHQVLQTTWEDCCWYGQYCLTLSYLLHCVRLTCMLNWEPTFRHDSLQAWNNILQLIGT